MIEKKNSAKHVAKLSIPRLRHAVSISAAQKTNDPSAAVDNTKAKSALWSIPAVWGARSNTVCMGVAVKTSRPVVSSTFAASVSLRPLFGVDPTSSAAEFFALLQHTTATTSVASAASAMPTKTHACSRDLVVSAERAVGTGCGDAVGASGVTAAMVGAGVILIGEPFGASLGACDGAREGA